MDLKPWSCATCGTSSPARKRSTSEGRPRSFRVSQSPLSRQNRSARRGDRRRALRALGTRGEAVRRRPEFPRRCARDPGSRHARGRGRPREGPRLHDDIIAAFRARDQPLDLAHEEASSDVILMLVASGEGLSLFPESAASTLLAGVVFKRVRDLDVVILGRAVWRAMGRQGPARAVAPRDHEFGSWILTVGVRYRAHRVVVALRNRQGNPRLTAPCARRLHLRSDRCSSNTLLR